jgi:hypothetical protein
MDPEWNPKVQAWLASVEQRGASYVCSEGAYEQPTDGWLQTDKRPVFFCGQSVISYSSLKDSALDPPMGLCGATWMPDIAIFTSMTTELPGDRETVEQAVLARIVEGTLAVVIGAWDDEGSIVWEPDSADA